MTKPATPLTGQYDACLIMSRTGVYVPNLVRRGDASALASAGPLDFSSAVTRQSLVLLRPRPEPLRALCHRGENECADDF